MRLHRSALAALSLVSLLAFAGCASGSDEAAEDGASDLSMGSRLWSPFQVGDYDAATDATLHLYNVLDRQYAWVELGSIYVTCSGGQLDIVDGKAHVANDSQNCSFDIERAPGGQLRVHGRFALGATFDTTFAPRPDDALVGRYTAPHGLVVTITKSTSDAFTFSMVQTETANDPRVEYNKDSVARRDRSEFEFDGELGKLCTVVAKRDHASYRLDFQDRELDQPERCPYGYVARP